MEMQPGPNRHQRHRELSQLGERLAAFKIVAYLGGCPSVPGSTSSGSSGSSGGSLGSGGALTMTPTISICTPVMDSVPIVAHAFVIVTRMRAQTQTQTYRLTHRHTGTLTHRHTDTQTRRHADTQTHRHTDTQTHRHISTASAGPTKGREHKVVGHEAGMLKYSVWIGVDRRAFLLLASFLGHRAGGCR